jgi:hypothetical protein
MELLGLAASKWLGRVGGLVMALLLLFALVVLVPARFVIASPAYAAARELVLASDPVNMEIGGVEGFEKLPHFYRLEKDRAQFRFEVQGFVARGIASVSVDRSDGVWRVTSASFVSDPRLPGVHRRLVLVRGEAPPSGR